MGKKPVRWRWAGLAAVVAVGVLAGPATAGHWHRRGWRDLHHRYPPRPSGYAEILKVFGQPCSDRAKANWLSWRAADTGKYYRVRFHRRLGGAVSSNLDHDVRGHIGNAHLDRYVKSGIWGYLCRFIAGTTKWSTHAWGIAVDVSSRFEPRGRCDSVTNHHHAAVWRKHRWKWGLSWCDPMHFQYATGY